MAAAATRTSESEVSNAARAPWACSCSGKGSLAAVRTTAGMWASLLLVVPVGLVLGLLAFGDHGGSRLRRTPASLTAVGVAALAAGPVAVELMGAFFWLLGVALVVACFTIVVVLRVPRHPVPD